VETAFLRQYFDRIGLPRAPAGGPGGLAELVRAHRLAIPFENLAIRQGRAIDLAPEAIFAKLVTGGRGGYCFEQNLLLSRVLSTLGIEHRPLLARVWMHAPDGPTPPRTHLFLAVRLGAERHGDEPWLADVGFGGGFCPPLPLGEHAPAAGPDGMLHRLRRHAAPGSECGEWMLERSPDQGRNWQPQYGFDTSDVARADIESANHWTSTRADTRFTTLHIASRVTPAGLISLVDHECTETAHGQTSRRTISDMAEWHAVLAGRFGLDLNLAEVAGLPLFATREGVSPGA
jgi:N-hydroxyarylamine O-acetyltransferase